MLGIFRFGNYIQVSVPGCLLGFFCEFCVLSHCLRLVVRSMHNLLHFCYSWSFIHRISPLQTTLIGTASDSALFRRLQKASKRFDRDLTDPNGSCLFSAGSPTDTVGSQNFQTLSTRQIAFLLAKPTMPALLLRISASVCRRCRS